MKNVLIIKPHSFVDLITNSSSELFVCETSKSIEAVKAVVETLVKLYFSNEDNRDITSEEIWTDLFDEPEMVDGKIHLNSADDNSVPYDIHPMLMKMLNAERYRY